jgi:cell fate regulator YaaT (PSP1 superfamily)
MQPTIIGVRFSKIGKVYHFDGSAVPDVQDGEHVIVDTSRGKNIGEVAVRLEKTPPPPVRRPCGSTGVAGAGSG